MGRTKKDIHLFRKVTQVSFFVFFLLIPYLNLLRYDSYHKQFFLFGIKWQLGVEEAIKTGSAIDISLKFLLKAILPWLGALAFFPLMGFLFGRLFCGWFCPEGLLFEVADFFTLKIFGRRNLYRGPNSNTLPVHPGKRYLFLAIALLFYLTVPAGLGFLLSGYFVPPEILWQQARTAHFSYGVKAAMAGLTLYVIITSVFLRHTFCKYICAPGLMQVLFAWISPLALRVRFKRGDLSRCTDCRACERVCFMGVRPRSPKPDINCVNCGECIDACASEIGEPLFEFTFHKYDQRHRQRTLKDLSSLYKTTLDSEVMRKG